ncbi:hypothetical protein MRX96_009200 [Rhipicephalus microplus]
MHGLRKARLNPNNFEKMRVPYAYQLFGLQVARGLRFYQQDVDPSRRNCIQANLWFFEMINRIITIMPSRHDGIALRLNSSAVNCLYIFLTTRRVNHDSITDPIELLKGASVHSWAVPTQSDGRLLIEDLESRVRYRNIPCPRTALLCLENTHNFCGGTVLSVDNVEQVQGGPNFVIMTQLIAWM